MADLEDNDTRAGSAPDGGRRRTSVTWRGIVDDPEPGAPSKHPRLAAVGRIFDRGAVAVGLKRGRNDDGTPAPRHSGRLAGLIGAIVVVFLAITMLHIVNAGTVMVPITLGDAGSAEGQGLHITLPWPITQVATMNVQTQNYTMTQAKIPGTDSPVQVLGSDGASATVDATVLYKLQPNRASNVYTTIGTSFGPKLVQPAARSCIYGQFHSRAMVDAATTQNRQVSDAIVQCIKNAIQPYGVTLQAFQLRQVVLQNQVQNAINNKIVQQQNEASQIYQEQVAQAQKRISDVNALATFQAQQVVACGGQVVTTKDENGQDVLDVVPNPNGQCQTPNLTQEELQYNYIQVLRAIITSNKNSTVIVPGGSSTPNVVVPTK
jgi:regulator of protease activity HflC (stomatin/prohibitin superfamily)